MNHHASRRAERLARLYPREWRRQYPDFVEVLASELTEHPGRARGDVLRGAAIERLRAARVLPARPLDRARSGLALVYAALVPFVGLSTGMWSQLHTTIVGQHSMLPVLRSTDLVLSVGTVLALASLAFAVPLVAAHAVRRRRHTAAGMATPAQRITLAVLGFAASMATLTVGGWAADRSGWYSPAAAALPARGASHVVTLWIRDVIATITPAWVHPSLFGSMPAGELLAALVAPLGVLAAGVTLQRLIVRLPVLAPRRVHVTGAVASVGAMFLSTAATVRWLLTRPHPEGGTLSVAHAEHLAPGHTAWVVAIALLGLAVTAAAGARWVLQGAQGPPRKSHGHWTPASSWEHGGSRSTTYESFAPIIAEP